MQSEQEFPVAQLPELPRPNVCYADHSYPAYSAKQMQEYALAALRTARALMVPEGWQVVPKVATKEMRRAVLRAWSEDAGTVWAETLAAAPKPEDTTNEG